MNPASPPSRELVTVVIPTRDRPHLLRRAIQGILAQDHESLELIIVDDASGPETARVIEEAAVEDSRVRSLRLGAVRGAAGARNAGAELSRGEYLLFEDDDCASQPGKVGTLLTALRGSPDAAFAYSHWRLRRHGKPVTLGFDGPWGISTSAALIRARLFHEVGAFDADLPRLQDFDLWTRLLGRWPAVEVPEVLFEMDRGGEGISGSTERLAAAADRLLIKYRDGDLPDHHVATMHRRIGGKLVLAGLKWPGVGHYREAVRRCAWCVRSWVGLLFALAGPRFYRLVLRVAHELRRSTRSEPEPRSRFKDDELV